MTQITDRPAPMARVAVAPQHDQRPRPYWPILNAEQVARVVADARRFDGVAVCWHGTQQVLAFTRDRSAAVQAADGLCRLDRGTGYLSMAGDGVTVDGPMRVRLTGWPGTDRIGWVPPRRCGDAAALDVCEVRPRRADIRREYATLAWLTKWENAAEDAGELDARQRRTCRTCAAWATDDHLAGPAHANWAGAR
jgi:hypothetical protein